MGQRPPDDPDAPWRETEEAAVQAEDLFPNWESAKPLIKGAPADRWVEGKWRNPLCKEQVLRVEVELPDRAEFGKGELEAPGAHEVAPSRAVAWSRLLRAVAELEPRVETDLREVAKQLGGDWAGMLVGPDGTEMWIEREVDAWAQKWNLAGLDPERPWAERAAWLTLEQWTMYPAWDRAFPAPYLVDDEVGPLRAGRVLRGRLVDETAIRFLGAWNPEVETEALARARLRAEMRALLDAELERIARAYRSAGFKDVPKKTRQKPGRELEAERIFARRVVFRRTWQQIADETEKSNLANLRRICSEVAGELGIELPE